MPEDVASARGGGTSAGSTTGGFKLATLGPPAGESPVTNDVLGYAYRDNETFRDNFDKVEMIVRGCLFTLDGYVDVSGAPTDLANGAVTDIRANFWPNVYTFLHEMAQKRDGYRATDAALNTALNIAYRDSLIIAAKINIRVAAQLFCLALVNEAGKSTLSGFRTHRSRILRDLEASNRLVYPAEWDTFIDYWSHVYAAWERGPLVVNLFNLAAWIKAGGALAPASGAVTDWEGLPDLTSSTAVGNFLSDIELAFDVVERYNINVANTKTDIRNINSIYAMMGFPTPQTKLPSLSVDPAKFYAQFYRYGFLFHDTKGAGVNTWVYWPDARGSLDELINVRTGGQPLTTLDWIGAAGGPYAFDAQDDDTPGYTAQANKLRAYGMVVGIDWIHDSLALGRIPTSIYTREDGWVSLPREYDFTAAQGNQQFLWETVDLNTHPEGWRVIMSEESEEAYRHNFAPVGRTFQIPFDHFGQAYRKWLYAAYKIPYIT